MENRHNIAENDNGVIVGYTHHGPDSFSVWAGENQFDRKVISAGCDSESEAKMDALSFMEKGSDVHFVSGRGTGRLEDSGGNRIRGV